MAYIEVARTDLTDNEGSTLSIIVESNGVSWELYATHRRSDQLASEATHSNWWSFVDQSRALEHQEAKVVEAVAIGWKRRDSDV